MVAHSGVPSRRLNGARPYFFAQNDWENSTLFEINKEPAHTSFVPIDERGASPIFNKAASPYVHLLNGDWKFHWSLRPADRPKDFYRPDHDISHWDDLPVPSLAEEFEFKARK